MAPLVTDTGDDSLGTTTKCIKVDWIKAELYFSFQSSYDILKPNISMVRFPGRAPPVLELWLGCASATLMKKSFMNPRLASNSLYSRGEP